MNDPQAELARDRERIETNSRAARSRGRRWFLTALLAVMAVASVALTCNTGVGRESGWRTFTVNYCTGVPPIIICWPFDITWKAEFQGWGHLHNAETVYIYYYDLHHWDQQIAIDDYYFDGPPTSSYPFGVQLAMSTHVYSYSQGDLGLIPTSWQACPPAIYPADWLFWWTCWDGTINLGKPGGYGHSGAAVNAVGGGVMPIPLPWDDVEYTWYMYHE